MAGGRLAWVLGVDPGLDGGWALLVVEEGDERPTLLARGATTGLRVSGDRRRLDAVEVARALGGAMHDADVSPIVVTAVVEAVDAAPGQGVSSTGAFLRAAGVLEGVLAGLGVRRLERIAPAAWKASMGLRGGKAGKAESVALAQRLVGPVGVTEHEAEAILVAWCGVQRGLCWKHKGQ